MIHKLCTALFTLFEVQRAIFEKSINKRLASKWNVD